MTHGPQNVKRMSNSYWTWPCGWRHRAYPKHRWLRTSRRGVKSQMTSVFMYAGLVICKVSNMGHFSGARWWERFLSVYFVSNHLCCETHNACLLWRFVVRANVCLVKGKGLSNLHLWQQETTIGDTYHFTVRREGYASSRLTSGSGCSIALQLTRCWRLGKHEIWGRYVVRRMGLE
jgi:hypothetical protein